MKYLLFDVYSYKGMETVACEVYCTPIWQVIQELEQKYKQRNNIKSSIIITNCREL